MIDIIKYLEVRNIALIDHAVMEFGEGFNVLTGETAAGKSLIIDSINMVLGGRSGKHLIREGACKARTEALFVFGREHKNLKTLFNYYGIDLYDDLVISREMGNDGRSICRINGKIVNLGILKEIGKHLVNIHGQHDNQELLSAQYHIDFLDRFAGIEDYLSQYRESYKKYCQARKDLESFIKNQTDKKVRMDFLNFQINEIENFNLKPGEEEQLENKLKKLQFTEKICKASAEAFEYLYSLDNSAYSLVSKALKCIKSASSYDENLSKAESLVNEILINISEASSLIGDNNSFVETGDKDIDAIQSRLNSIYNLKMKYAKNVEEIIEYCDHIKSEHALLLNSEESVILLEKKLEEERENLTKLAEVLREKRYEASGVLEKSITKEINDLSMPDSFFTVKIEDCDFYEKGKDKAEFMISTNKGSSAKPLNKIASGGELSRIMLASKAVLAGTDEVGTLVFDEIDMGISGKTANLVADKIAQISEKKQVICITHLAQIACKANRHFVIRKESDGKRVNTMVQLLPEERRYEELARIIGGSKITGTTIEHAKEMLELAFKD